MSPVLILVFLCLGQCYAHGKKNSTFTRLQLPSTGFEALAFDLDNGGPYTGLNDGRIVKYQGPELGFVDFATTVANRPKEQCDGTDGSNRTMSLLCGRPLGMEFNRKTGELYITDAYRGLLVVGKNGGVAKLVSADMHYDFADAVDIDHETGVAYVVDLGSIFSHTNNMTDILLRGTERTGRVLKYDPSTNKTTVLLDNLAMPAGLALSSDASFLIVGEYLNCSVKKYWLKGPKAHTTETLVELAGNPDNIRRTHSGNFWIAANIHKLQPRLIGFPVGQKINAEGQILETVTFYNEYNSTYISEVIKHLDKYYVASISTNFVGVYTNHIGC
jgi:sugar lactone lactonase YvrE